MANPIEIDFQLIPYLSTAYFDMVRLRSEILRQPLGLKFSLEELSLDQDAYLWGGYHNQQLICCAKLEKTDNKIRLKQMAVNAQYQHKGIGTILLQHIVQWSKQQDVASVWCHARISAMPFYTKNQWQTEGDIFTEVGIPHIRMYLNL